MPSTLDTENGRSSIADQTGSVGPPVETLPNDFLELLCCPIERTPLTQEDGFLVSSTGRRYPIIEGVPVLLNRYAVPTMGSMRASLEFADLVANGKPVAEAPWYVSTLGLTPTERAQFSELTHIPRRIDPVVSMLIGATNGVAYRHLISKEFSYPIPPFRFPGTNSGLLLDIGCNWGRWTIAAARQGYSSVGIDPQLGAVLAAKRLADTESAKAHFVVADARHLPFKDSVFDYAWSYSVLQHFSWEDADAALKSAARVLKGSAKARIQMANAQGLRNRIKIKNAENMLDQGEFRVRYWDWHTLHEWFACIFGTAEITPDCYFGLGLQRGDAKLYEARGRAALFASEGLKQWAKAVPALARAADSVFVDSRKIE